MKKNLFLALLAVFAVLGLYSKTLYGFFREEKSTVLDNDFHKKNKDFIKSMAGAKECYASFDVMIAGLDNTNLEGFYLEMGVFQGTTINFIASMKKDQTIYGFDSFKGLPEAWSRDDTTMFSQGFFAMSDLPVVEDNVVLISGWFEDTLPFFQRTEVKNQAIAFIHIDCDIYSSTKTIFDALGDNIVPGTVLVFDEMYNYPGFDRHELKALHEFLEHKNYDVAYIAYNVNSEQVAVKIIEKNSV